MASLRSCSSHRALAAFSAVALFFVVSCGGGGDDEDQAAQATTTVNPEADGSTTSTKAEGSSGSTTTTSQGDQAGDPSAEVDEETSPTAEDPPPNAPSGTGSIPGQTPTMPWSTTTVVPIGTSAPPSVVPPIPSSGPPDKPLTPSSPEWVAACGIADQTITLAWKIEQGTSADEIGLALLIVSLIDALPPGTSPSEVAYLTDLIETFVAGGDLTPFEPEFRPTARELLITVGAGCGIAAGEPLPLPSGSIDLLYYQLFVVQPVP